MGKGSVTWLHHVPISYVPRVRWVGVEAWAGQKHGLRSGFLKLVSYPPRVASVALGTGLVGILSITGVRVGVRGINTSFFSLPRVVLGSYISPPYLQVQHSVGGRDLSRSFFVGLGHLCSRGGLAAPHREGSRPSVAWSYSMADLACSHQGDGEDALPPNYTVMGGHLRHPGLCLPGWWGTLSEGRDTVGRLRGLRG